jgi:hypothetical protein
MQVQVDLSTLAGEYADALSEISESVQKAIVLLYWVKDRAIAGVGEHGAYDSPIAKGYGVIARRLWMAVSERDQAILLDAGWTPEVFDDFVEWYSYDPSKRIDRQTILEAILTSDKSPSLIFIK